jgi:hypothetical protein
LKKGETGGFEFDFSRCIVWTSSTNFRDTTLAEYLKSLLQAAQKDPEARRANYKDESGNLKAEFSFQLS